MKKAVLSIMASLTILAGGTSAFASSQTKLTQSISAVVGTPYKYGGTTTKGFDCSGFVLYIFKKFDVKLPRTSKSQATVGEKVAKSDLREGDLVFFNTSGKGISHAGVYIGGGKFAHSSSSKGVTISKLSDSYYKKRYVTARRVVGKTTYSKMVKA